MLPFDQPSVDNRKATLDDRLSLDHFFAPLYPTSQYTTYIKITQCWKIPQKCPIIIFTPKLILLLFL